MYGLPDLRRIGEADALRWIQLASAGVPGQLCVAVRKQNIRLTNLAGLYGPSIAEHALGMMLFLSRNLHMAHRNQQGRRWDQSVAGTMRDLHGKTLAVVGLGNIGQNVARLARAFGMRVLGCRQRPRPIPLVDRVYAPPEVRAMLGEADYVVVAAPLTPQSERMLGAGEFGAMKPGTILVNVSRGRVIDEAALIRALESETLAAAGLDVFADEPLAREHAFWGMPNVFVSPHYSGDAVNNSTLPAERFARNLRAWRENRELEGEVDLERGY